MGDGRGIGGRLAALWKAAARGAGDRRGGVAVYTAIMAPLLVSVTAFAVDYGRVASKKAQIQAALDAATLAATQALSTDEAMLETKLREIGEAFFSANIDGLGDSASCDPLAIAVDRPEIEVTLQATCSLTSVFGSVLTEDGFEVGVISTTNFDFGQADIAFMLDTSGSMGGSAKIGALRTAMKDAVDTLTAISRNGSIRIALAPYSTGLDAGAYANPATGFPGNDGDSCVTGRSGLQAYTDAPPNVATLTDNVNQCPSPAITPLTDNATLLKNRIDALPATGWTAGHLGIAWSWYMISPRWQGFWPAASRPKPDGPQTRKAVVLMTDGKFNRTYVSGMPNSATQAREMCGEMKKDGVLVYAVAFKAPKNSQKLLLDCSSGPEYYYEPENADALKEAYRSIADSFRRLILTN